MFGATEPALVVQQRPRWLQAFAGTGLNDLVATASITKCMCEADFVVDEAARNYAVCLEYVPPILLAAQIILLYKQAPKTTLVLLLLFSATLHLSAMYK